MSPIHNLQPRIREVVRIRTGETISKKGKSGKEESRPVALTTFGFSSATREPLERLAAVYGGEVKDWQEPASDHRFKVITEASVIDCLIPPTAGFSQWYELWSGGGCQRRCDGERELTGDTPCICDTLEGDRQKLIAEGKACRPTTRLTVVLKEIGELAGARLESHGYYAAVELASAEALYAAARERGMFVPGQLRLNQRSTKRPGQARRDYVVPELVIRTEDVMGALAAGGAAPRAIGAGDERTTTDGPIVLERERRAQVPQPPAPRERPAAADGQVAPPAAARPSDQGVAEAEITELLQTFHQAGLREDEAAQVVHLVTAERTKNIKTLTEPELANVKTVATQLRVGALELVFDGERAQLIDREGNLVAVVDGEMRTSGPAEYSGPWWGQRIRGSGVTQSGLLRKARSIAEDLGVDVPAALDELTHPPLAEQLRVWLEENRRAAS